MTPEKIHSKDNPLIKTIRALARDGGAYKRAGQIWVEGDHLIRAAIGRGWQPLVVVWTASGLVDWAQGLQWAGRHVEVDVSTMRGLSQLESPARVGALFAWPKNDAMRSGLATVVLDRLQDPGNVGSILRTASAMGFKQVVTLRGTVGMWSPKVIRAGMGAHFNLNLIEGVDAEQLRELGVPLIATHVHEGDWLHKVQLPMPCAWLFGHEGQGISGDVLGIADRRVRIHQAGGEESLNVAAAAAICLHASAAVSQR